MIKLQNHKQTSGGIAGSKKTTTFDGNDAKSLLQKCVKILWTHNVDDLTSLTMELDKTPAVTLSADNESRYLSFLSDLGRVEFVEKLVAIIKAKGDFDESN
jgi:hypothetical protein